MVEFPGWAELKDLLTKVAKLTGNVSALMKQVDKNSVEISEL